MLWHSLLSHTPNPRSPCNDTVHTVNPAGHRETNTITRAELCGIAAAFDHEASLTIFTDSLASLFLLQSALHSPDSLTEKKRAPLQLYIRELLLARAALGFHTHMQKVPSHCGVIGNDLADIGAALALRNPAACQHSMSHVCPHPTLCQPTRLAHHPVAHMCSGFCCMVTAQCCGRMSGSLNPRPRAYYLFIYLLQPQLPPPLLSAPSLPLTSPLLSSST